MNEIIELIKKNLCRLECNLNSIVNQSDQSNPIINVHFDGSRQIIKTLYGLIEYIDTRGNVSEIENVDSEIVNKHGALPVKIPGHVEPMIMRTNSEWTRDIRFLEHEECKKD